MAPERCRFEASAEAAASTATGLTFGGF